MAKIIKERVIAFRLTPDEFKEFNAIREQKPIVGIRSVGALARKLALDYARNKLKWASKRDQGLAPDVADAKKASAA